MSVPAKISSRMRALLPIGLLVLATGYMMFQAGWDVWTGTAAEPHHPKLRLALSTVSFAALIFSWLMTFKATRPAPAKCSFCGKAKTEVKTLVAGPGVYICDSCVNIGKTIIDRELTSGGP